MTKVTDEMLMALADGELDEPTVREVWRLTESDPSLRRRLEEAHATRRMAKEAFSGVLTEPVPEALIRAVGQPKAPASRLSRLFQTAWLPVGAAAAASIVGFAVGTVFVLRSADGPSPLPRAEQIAALVDSVPSGEARSWPTESGAAGTFEATATYPIPDGVCRTFSVSTAAREANDWQGVACHHGGAWNLDLLVARPRAGGASFSTASDSATQSVDGFLDAQSAGEPLDSAAERRLHDAGWRTTGKTGAE